MKTLLPYPNFRICAFVMDQLNLESQIIEAKDVIRRVQGRIIGYSAHPYVSLWSKNIGALMLYHDCMVMEYHRRAIDNGQRPKMQQILARDYGQKPFLPESAAMPAWLGRWELHSSHRAWMKFTWPDRYEKFPEEPGDAIWFPWDK